MLDGDQWYGGKKSKKVELRIVEDRSCNFKYEKLPQESDIWERLKEVKEWAKNLSA